MTWQKIHFEKYILRNTLWEMHFDKYILRKTIFDIFRQFCQLWIVFTILDFFRFDSCEENSGDLWHSIHWLQSWQLRTWIHDNPCYLTFNCGTGKHSQFLRCFNCSHPKLQYKNVSKLFPLQNVAKVKTVLILKHFQSQKYHPIHNEGSEVPTWRLVVNEPRVCV